MIRRYAFWTATVLAVLTAAPAWAADDVFHSIPTDALAFVAVNRIAEASAKIQKLARQVGSPFIALLEMAKGTSGATKGVDETGTAAVVFMPGKDSKSKPPPVFLIPVADYKQFLEAWDAKPADKDKIIEVKIGGETMLVAQRGGYAAIAPKELRHGLEKLLAAKRSIADEYPQMLPWLTENDAVAVGTSSGIKLASKAMQEQLQQMKDIFARMNMDEDTPSPVMVMEMYANVLQWAEKEVERRRHCGPGR